MYRFLLGPITMSISWHSKTWLISLRKKPSFKNLPSDDSKKTSTSSSSLSHQKCEPSKGIRGMWCPRDCWHFDEGDEVSSSSPWTTNEFISSFQPHTGRYENPSWRRMLLFCVTEKKRLARSKFDRRLMKNRAFWYLLGLLMRSRQKKPAGDLREKLFLISVSRKKCVAAEAHCWPSYSLLWRRSLPFLTIFGVPKHTQTFFFLSGANPSIRNRARARPATRLTVPTLYGTVSLFFIFSKIF